MREGRINLPAVSREIVPVRTLSRRARHCIAAIALVAFALRALVPAGYMPSSDHPLTLQICGEGLDASPLAPAHHHHAALQEYGQLHHHEGLHAGTPSNGTGTFRHCPFGSAPLPAPVAQIPAALLTGVALATPVFQLRSLVVSQQLVRSQRARAPPPLSR
jgi:hypothetical protein